MNRRQRRVSGQRITPETQRTIADATVCADCLADITITEIAPRVFAAAVIHDDSCPWYLGLVQ